MLHIRLFIGIIGIIFFVATFEFIRKRHLREEYAILWLFTSSIVADPQSLARFDKYLERDNRTLLYYGRVHDCLFFCDRGSHALLDCHIENKGDEQGADAEVRTP